MFRYFSERTSLHANADIVQSDSKWLKIFWVVVICAFNAGAVYEIYQVFEGFKNSPIITRYSMKSTDKLKMPIIEVCLANNINKSTMQSLAIVPQLMDIVLSSFETSHQGLLIDDYAREMANGTDALFEQNSDLDTLMMLSKSVDEASRRVHRFNTMFNQNLTEKQIDSIIKDFNKHLGNYITRAGLANNGSHDFFKVHAEEVLARFRRKSNTSGKTAIDVEKLTDMISFDMNKVFRKCQFGSRVIPCERFISKRFSPMSGSCYVIDTGMRQASGGVGFQALIDLNSQLAYDQHAFTSDSLDIMFFLLS